MPIGDGVVLTPSDGRRLTLLGGHGFRLIHREAGSPYSVIEWLAPPAIPGPPLHLERGTDEAFYVLEGTFGFQVGDETVDAPSGTYIFIPRGVAHTFWNGGATNARYISVISPPGIESYLEELAEGLASVGNSEEEALRRQQLATRYDLEFLGPPRQAGK
jgi:mannose-6-phosphate isomerase-like protein (cupin superfamily)